jgi:hypothetical protein
MAMTADALLTGVCNNLLALPSHTAGSKRTISLASIVVLIVAGAFLAHTNAITACFSVVTLGFILVVPRPKTALSCTIALFFRLHTWLGVSKVLM